MTGLSRPTLTELLERAHNDINARLPGADSRLRHSALSALAITHAGALHGAYGYLNFLSEQLLPDTADAEHLARWAAIFGLSRQAAAPATGPVTATGGDGSTIAAGTVLQRGDGAEFVTQADATVAAGTATLTVEASSPGLQGNSLAGVQMTFTSPVTGVATAAVVGVGGLTGGKDEEGDDLLRARLLARIQEPPAGGKASDYEAWANDVFAGARVWVYPNATGLGTVGVAFVMPDGSIPDAGEVTAVQDYVDDRRPVGAEVTVFAPTGSAQAFSLHIAPDTAEIRAAIEASLADLFARESEPGGTLLISHIREAISIAAGEVDHTLTTPNANVTASAGQIKTLGAFTWT